MPGTGREGQVGFGEEVTPGTAVVVTRFFEWISESVKLSREPLESAGLRAGKKTQNLWVAGRKSVEGDIELEVMPNGFGIIPKYLLGGTPVTTTPDSVGAPAVRLHTTKVGALDGKAMTVQIGRPNIAGTTDPYTYSGCKVSAWELAMEVGGVLMLKMSLDAMDETTATALATASYPTTNVMMSWADPSLAFTIGGTSYNVGKLTLAANNGVKGDRYKLGSAVKLEQIEGTAFREYTGTIDLESYAGLTPYNLFKNGTEAQVVATFTGAIAGGALPYMVRVTLPRVRFDGDTPNIGGPDILAQSIPFKALWTNNAATEVQIEVQNTDVAP